MRRKKKEKLLRLILEINLNKRKIHLWRERERALLIIKTQKMIVVLASRVRLSFLVTRATNVSWIPNSAANLVQKLQAKLTVLAVGNSRCNTFIPCSEMKILSEQWPNQFYEKNSTSTSGCSSLLLIEVSF